MAWGQWAANRVAPGDTAQQSYLRNVAGAANRAGWNPTQTGFGSGITLPSPSASSTAIANNPTVQPQSTTPGVTAPPVAAAAPATGPGTNFGIKNNPYWYTGPPGQYGQPAGGAAAPSLGDPRGVGVSGGGTNPAAVMPGGAPGPLGTVHANNTGYDVQGGVWGPGGYYDPRLGMNTNSPTPQNLYNYVALQNTPQSAADAAKWGRQASAPVAGAAPFGGANFPLTQNKMQGMLPGESTLQYALRMGLAPNEASQFLAGQAGANPTFG